MTPRLRPVHSSFESLQAARLIPRLNVRGRPACFATNEQLTALALSAHSGRPGPGYATFLDLR